MEDARSEQPEEAPIPFPDPRHLGSKGSVGALAEIEVAADLMARGFHVYRNLAPVGPVDMVAIAEDGRMFKVQATMGQAKPLGGRSFNRHDCQPHWDILAVAFHDKVRYFDRKRTEFCPLARLDSTGLPPEKTGQSSPNESTGCRPDQVVVAGQVTGTLIPRTRRPPLPWIPLPGHKGVYVRPWSKELGEAAAPRPF